MSDDELIHYGTPRHSGRYPWGSGEDPEQSGKSFLSIVDELHEKGLSDVEIARGLQISTTELRKRRAVERNAQRVADVAMAQRLKEKGMSNVAIGERMGKNESSVRALLNPMLSDKSNVLQSTSNIIKNAVGEDKIIDIGIGVETQLGVSRTKFNNAVTMLEDEGYKVHKLKVEQLGTGKMTTLKVVAPPDMPFAEVNRKVRNGEFSAFNSYSEDGGRNWLGMEPPTTVSRKRVFVRYGDEGGSQKDGLIELRRGVPDIDLGAARYAQVRIAVEGDMFMKGMAIHADVPSGFDIVYNTNKKRGAPDVDTDGKAGVFKKMKDDPETGNPFGSTVRQKHYDSGGESKLSALNIVGSPNVTGSGEEGSWGQWSRSLSSQVLSKQLPSFAKKQLAEALDRRTEEFDEIMSLTNPTIKKRLLETYADECDSAAVHLKGAALPRQASHVILPFPSIRENEVYAPNYKDGELVALVRHPHGGPFEIPELIVNNKNKEAITAIGRNAKDAIGINPKVAERLSGADFDGDTVLVIPNDKRQIRSKPRLQALIDFDPKAAYPYREGIDIMTEDLMQTKMGDVSNLITDMTIRGANDDEIARAVKHSMVVIDAKKHKLDYKRSYIEQGIAQLKTKYQGGPTKGASTLISKASSQARPLKRKPGVYIEDPVTGKKKRVFIDPETGKKLYTLTGESYEKPIYDKKGPFVEDPKTGKKRYLTVKGTKTVFRRDKSTKMAEEENALNLSSGTPIEEIYGNHANALKALANTARKETLSIAPIPYSPAAKVAYQHEVEALQAKLRNALRNKPLERQAQVLANAVVSAKRRENPGMDADDLKKLKGQALEEARTRTGAKKDPFELTDREWEAIQSGAISNNSLTQIVLLADLDALKQRAMPRTAYVMSPARVARARSMRANGSTTAEIAQALGVSVGSLEEVLV